MERIIDDLECKRRADEIYSRRNGLSFENSKKRIFSIYKLLFQLLVLINLALGLCVYSNRNYIFNSEFLKQIENFYNVNILEKVNSFFIEDSENKENMLEQNVVESSENVVNSQENDENIKESYSFIKPIEGTITSFFGNRESENSNISGFHSGIDISAIEGTKIKSAISGIVVLVSNKGNYGNHLKIKTDNIITLYAHCKKIFVTEGEYITQGKEIAEVGSTGKSTGPHLHFEIRYNDEYLNPNEYISF